MNLVDISKVPSAENSAIHLHPGDHVAIARVPLSAGQTLRIGGVEIVTRQSIPAGHKVALRQIAPGETVRRYGQAIGRAKQVIAPGDHVHTHNVAFEELTFDYEFPSGEIPIPAAPADAPTFWVTPARTDARGPGIILPWSRRAIARRTRRK